MLFKKLNVMGLSVFSLLMNYVQYNLKIYINPFQEPADSSSNFYTGWLNFTCTFFYEKKSTCEMQESNAPRGPVGEVHGKIPAKATEVPKKKESHD